MSVLDDLRGLEASVASRMKELRPLVDEYRELEQVAQRLGLNPDDAATEDRRSPKRGRRTRTSVAQSANGASGATTRRAGSGKSGRAKRTKRAASAPPGQREEQVRDAIQQQPGVTVRELGRQLGVDPTSLYRIVHRLERDGTIKKDGRQLQPA